MQSAMHANIVNFICWLASSPSSCQVRGRKESLIHVHCLCMHSVPWVTCILLHYTKITVMQFLFTGWKATLQYYTMVIQHILPVGHIWAVLNNFALIVCIASGHFTSVHTFPNDVPVYVYHSTGIYIDMSWKSGGINLEWVPGTQSVSKIFEIWIIFIAQVV